MTGSDGDGVCGAGDGDGCCGSGSGRSTDDRDDDSSGIGTDAGGCEGDGGGAAEAGGDDNGGDGAAETGGGVTAPGTGWVRSGGADAGMLIAVMVVMVVVAGARAEVVVVWVVEAGTGLRWW